MDKKSLRGQYGESLAELGAVNKDIVVLDADLAKSTKTLTFGEKFGDRFFDMGLSEQDMVSTAAGIALTGKTVFASSFSVFRPILGCAASSSTRASVDFASSLLKLLTVQ